MEDDDRVREATLATRDAEAARPGLIRRVIGALVSTESVRGVVYVLLDLSASMGDRDKLPQLRRGALRFFAHAWTLEYAVGAIGFSRHARVLQAATRDFRRFQACVERMDVGGRTAMADAIGLATRRLRRTRGDRVILLITDGMPNSREATLAAAQAARAEGITLIAVGTDGADEEFLASLTGRPELTRRVDAEDFGRGVEASAARLPGRSGTSGVGG